MEDDKIDPKKAKGVYDSDVLSRRIEVERLHRSTAMINRLIELQISDMRHINRRINYIQASYDQKNIEKQISRHNIDIRLKSVYAKIIDKYKLSVKW